MLPRDYNHIFNVEKADCMKGLWGSCVQACKKVKSLPSIVGNQKFYLF